MTRDSWMVRLLARTVAPAHRDAIVDDLLDDYRSELVSGKAAGGARRHLYVDLFKSGLDSRRQAWLERRAASSGLRSWSLVADLRAAWRQHRRQPAGTISALLTIALAIGVNTALVSVVRSTLMRPLPFRDPGQIVFIWDAQPGRDRLPMTPARAIDFRDRPASIAGGALIGHNSMTVTGLGPAERWSGASVSAAFFDVLGANPEIGRTFHASDPERDGVVLSHHWWVQRLGGDPSWVGRTITMNGKPRTITGVMPDDFFWPSITATPSAADGPDFWACAPAHDAPEGAIPTIENKPRDRQAGYVRLVARLAPHATLASARTELSGVAEALGREYPLTDGGHTVVVVPLNEQFFGSVRQPLVFLLLASVLVVVLACVNVANLLVMRLPARARELAIRVALGASRFRLARLLLIEGVMLAIGGGLAGVALAQVSLRGIASLAPPGVGRLDRLALDAGVLTATAAAVLGCALVLGLLPAVIVWRSRPAHDLRAAGAAPGSRPRLRQALVALEVALALALVVGATLFGQSLLRLRRVDVGFETRGLLTFDVNLVGDRAEYQRKQVTFFEDMFSAIRALPGVSNAAGAVTLPIGGDDFASAFYAEEQAKPPRGSELHVGFQIIGAHWFDTLGMRIVAGRDFTELDNHRDAPVAIVNETLAERTWPGRPAVGQQFRYDADPKLPPLTVVGVVSDIRHLGPASRPRPEFYQPYYQASLPFLAVAVRTSGDPWQLVAPIRAAIAKLDPAQPISGVATMSEHLSRAYGDERFLSTLTLAFGALALVLAVVGVYGVVGWSSAQRTREFGLRTALGATPATLASLVLRQGMWPVVVGAVFGTASALAASRSIRGLLFDTASADPRLYALAVVLVLAAAVLACWIPARRAGKIDPVRALTAEP